MADINLLGAEQKHQALPWQSVSSVIVKLLSIVAVGFVLIWGVFFYLTKAAQNDVYKTQESIKTTTNKLADLPQRKQVVARQSQLKAFNTIVTDQSHWSTFIVGKLAPMTLNTARYVNVSGESNGQLRMGVVVPGYADLDKFIQAFDYPELNKVFTNIKVVSLSKSQVGDKVEVKFDVTMQYNPQALKTEVK